MSEDYPSHVPPAAGKVEALPRWAREHIEHMTRRIEELSRAIEGLKTGRPGNTTVRRVAGRAAGRPEEET